jgi:hypothetical protein
MKKPLALIIGLVLLGLMALGQAVSSPPSSPTDPAPATPVISLPLPQDECLAFEPATTRSRRYLLRLASCPVMPPQQAFDECFDSAQSKNQEYKLGMLRLDMRLACVDTWQNPAVRQQWHKNHPQPEARKWTPNGHGFDNWIVNCMYLTTGLAGEWGLESLIEQEACLREWKRKWEPLTVCEIQRELSRLGRTFPAVSATAWHMMSSAEQQLLQEARERIANLHARQGDTSHCAR